MIPTDHTPTLWFPMLYVYAPCFSGAGHSRPSSVDTETGSGDMGLSTMMSGDFQVSVVIGLLLVIPILIIVAITVVMRLKKNGRWCLCWIFFIQLRFISTHCSTCMYLASHFSYALGFIYEDSGSCLNIKMSSYQYRDSYVKDKTVSRPSYLWHGNPNTWERPSLYWDGPLAPEAGPCFNIKTSAWKWLTHDLNKMVTILQTTFSNAFSWMKMYEFRLRFHWSLLLRVQLTIFQHWFG